MTERTKEALTIVTSRLKALSRQEAAALLDQHKNGDVAQALLDIGYSAALQDEAEHFIDARIQNSDFACVLIPTSAIPPIPISTASTLSEEIPQREFSSVTEPDLLRSANVFDISVDFLCAA